MAKSSPPPIMELQTLWIRESFELAASRNMLATVDMAQVPPTVIFKFGDFQPLMVSRLRDGTYGIVYAVNESGRLIRKNITTRQPDWLLLVKEAVATMKKFNSPLEYR